MKKWFSRMRASTRRIVWFSLAVMLIFILVALLAPWISPHDPFHWDMQNTDLPAMWVKGAALQGSSDYILGTDVFGRDILSRLIYGARTALLSVLIAIPLAALIGTLVGLISGYFGGVVDRVVLAFTEMVHSVPGIMLIVIIVLIFRVIFAPTWINGFITLAIGYVAVSWVSLARLLRMAVLQTKSRLFVEAAVSIGASPWRLITRHIFPNVSHLVLVWIVNNVPAVILLEAVLGYIGVGLTSATGGGEFTVTSWGGLFYSGRFAIGRNPLMLIAPALCVLLISMSFILLADALNEQSQR